MKKLLVLLFIGGALLLPLLVMAISAPEPYREVVILMYHDIREEPVADNEFVISRETFRAQMAALREAGFETVSFDDLIAYVDHGAPLPPRALVITFDDGYRSNLEIAAPILREYGMQATISVIGIARGRDTYRDTDYPAIPHFSFEEARPWVEAGVIQIQHHSHDMHQVRQFEPPETFRRGVLQKEGESDEDYRAAFLADFETLRQAIEEALGTRVTTFVYPYGRYDENTEAMLQELGVRVTLTTNVGINTIYFGEPESLFLLRRINMTEAVDPGTILAFLEGFRE